MDYDTNCKWHKSCGADFCHGEGVCPDFKKAKGSKGMKLLKQCKFIDGDEREFKAEEGMIKAIKQT